MSSPLMSVRGQSKSRPKALVPTTRTLRLPAICVKTEGRGYRSCEVAEPVHMALRRLYPHHVQFLAHCFCSPGMRQSTPPGPPACPRPRRTSWRPGSSEADRSAGRSRSIPARVGRACDAVLGSEVAHAFAFFPPPPLTQAVHAPLSFRQVGTSVSDARFWRTTCVSRVDTPESRPTVRRWEKAAKLRDTSP